jgi:MscS family membrane protein
MRTIAATNKPTRSRSVRSGIAALSIALAFCALSSAIAAAAEPKVDPLAPADTSSPRGTLENFIESCNQLYEIIIARPSLRRENPDVQPLVRRILDCLDSSGLPEYSRDLVAAESAVCLKEVLDRVVALPLYAEIPGEEAVEEGDDGKPIASWRIPGTRIIIARVQEGPRKGEYLFSPETVERAPEFYEAAKDLPYRTVGPAVTLGFHDWYLSEPGLPAVAALVHALPDWCRSRWGGLAIWQWVALVLAVAVSLAAMYGVYRLGRRRGQLMKEKNSVRYALTLLFPIVAMLVPLAFKEFVSVGLTIRGFPLYVSIFVANLIFLLAALVVIVGAGNRIAALIIASPKIQPEGLDAQLIRLVAKVASLVAALFVFLEGGQYLGFPLTTLLASAGVGGLAVALAAQDTLKCVFGSMMILLDKPYGGGDRVVVGDYDGIVEEIGLRSTKIRLLNGHVACIPNEEMARSHIENVGRRPHVRPNAHNHITMDTPVAKVEQAVEIIRRALVDHEGMDPDFPPRVFFNEFNPTAFNVRIIYWYHPAKYWDFLAFSEKLNLEIFRNFEVEGIQFSLPFRVTYTDNQSKQAALDVQVVSQEAKPGPRPSEC